MFVLLQYQDASDEMHEVVPEVGNTLMEAWMVFHQNPVAELPASFLAVSGDEIAVRWTALLMLSVQA